MYTWAALTHVGFFNLAVQSVNGILAGAATELHPRQGTVSGSHSGLADTTNPSLINSRQNLTLAKYRPFPQELANTPPI